MNKFKDSDIWTMPEILNQVKSRLDAVYSIKDIGNPPPWFQEEANDTLVSGIGRCGDIQWEEFPNNKLYYDDTPVDLPKNGKWKYKLPVTYDVSKKTFQYNGLEYKNVESIKIEDRSKGIFKKDEHYYIRSNGEVWVKGSRPYLYLSVTANYKNSTGNPETIRFDIPPEDFSVNAEFVSVSNEKVRVPYRPCYEGYENIYNVYSYTINFYVKSANCNTQFDHDIDPQSPFMNTIFKFKRGIMGYEPYTQFQTKEAQYGPVYYDRYGGKMQDLIKPEEFAVGTDLYYIGELDPVKDKKQWREIGARRLIGESKNRYLIDENAPLTVIGPSIFPGGKYVSMSIDTKVTQIKEYTDQTRFSDLLDCECVKLEIITPPTVNKFMTPDCDCTVTVSEEIYIICPDEFTDKAYNEYLLGRQTPPTQIDLVNSGMLDLLEPNYRRIITADPCDFGDDSSRVWQKFASRDIQDVTKTEADGLFDSRESVNCYTTSSVQNSASKNYYYDVTECGICEVSKSYFSVAFGHYAGSGSIFESFEDDDSPTKSIFTQYRLKVLDDFSSGFEYYNNSTLYTSSMIYAITFTRNSIKDGIDPGNFELNLSELNGLSYSNNYYTGSNVAVSSSNKVLSLIDNSGDLTDMQSCSNLTQTSYFDIVSGSITDGIHSSGIGNATTNGSYKTYGRVYPNAGVIILDASLLNTELNFNSVTGSNINGDNAYKLFTSISGSTALNKPTKFRNYRRRNIRNYSVRIAPVECNVSNNPTYLRENGRLKHHCFIEEPVTYITTIGLYNESRELVAIAKLSKPIKKTKDDTIDIKIRLGV